ncbi:MAG: PH domain-containing protein [Rhodothermales bacterium]
MNHIEQMSDVLRPLDPHIQTVWRIKVGLFWLGVVAAAATYDVISLFGTDTLLPSGVLSGLAVVVAIGVVVIQPRLRYRYWRFDLRPEELYLERGILNRVRTIVPLRRIQHLDVSQDILEREFNLGKLIVHTAGARSSEVVLPGLQYEEAEALRDKLKNYILEDAV